MAAPLRVEIEAIIAEYERTKSIWKTGKALGICGQSVHERLLAVQYPLAGNRSWQPDELQELQELLANGVTAGDAAKRLNRSFAAIACKMNELGIKTRKDGTPKRIPRGAGYDKASVRRHVKTLTENPSLKITRYAKSQGLNVESLAKAFQKYFPEQYDAYLAEHHQDVPRKNCPYCKEEFIPANGKQVFCSRRCQADSRVDLSYFGGLRRNAVGYSERTCQICQKHVERPHVHHVIGKVNDPDNKYMVALCSGCHQMVGRLAWTKRIVNNAEAWERLIQFAWLEANGNVAEGQEVQCTVTLESFPTPPPSSLPEG